MPTPSDPRPRLTPALERIVAALVQLDELRGLRAEDILVVALGAHGTVAASIRSLPSTVTIEKKRRRVELGLRPPFFLDGDASRRLATLVHELLHLDPAKPGHLLEERRHTKRSHAKHEEHARTLAMEWLANNDPMPLLCLAHHGEVLMRQWRHRPTDAGGTFSDRDVFEGPLPMVTPKHARGSWWS